MSKYRIVTDATADLPQSLVEALNVSVIPMEVHLGDEVYTFEPTYSQLNPATFYEKVRSGAQPTTTLINAFTYETAFRPILESGEDILYIAFSSGLTGSQQNANLVAAELMEAYPERKIIVFDSRAASLGEGLLVYHACKKRDEGLTLAELTHWLHSTRNRLCHWFTVGDLHHLKRGRRVSATAATFGTALKIKPVLHVDDEGHLIPLQKVQGRKRSLKALVDLMHETCLPHENDVIFIGHGNCLEDAEYVKALVEKRFGFTGFLVDFIGPVIGAHSGPGTVALFHIGTHK